MIANVPGTIVETPRKTSKRGRFRVGSRSQFSALEARTLYSADLGLLAAMPSVVEAPLLPAEVGPPKLASSIELSTKFNANDKTTKGVSALAADNLSLPPAELTSVSDAGLSEPNSADLVSDDTNSSDTTADALKSTSAATREASQAPLEIVLIDSRVPDIASLKADLQRQIELGRNLAVLVIDSTNDGVQRATQMLALAGQPVSALHIISHAESGAITLGASRLDTQTLEANSAQLAQWSRHLGADADILFYGCDLAANQAGESMLSRLGEITGADIAASRDLTGAKDLGGNWDLEYRAGKIEASIATSTDLQSHWQNILAASTSGLLPVNQMIAGTQMIAPFQENGRNVAVNDSGDIAVTWVDMNTDAVMVRLFLPDGTARTGDIAVVARTLSDPGELWQYNPIVAMREDGSFIVSWVEKHDLGDDRLFAQRFTSEGLRLGSVIDVTGGQAYTALQRPDIDVDSAGNFFVAYEVFDGTKTQVRVSGFNANGELRFGHQQVGVTSSLFDGEASIAVKPDNGHFVVSWTMREPLGGYEIAAQQFDGNGNVLTTNGFATGSPWANVLWVNSTTFGAQYQSSIAISASGEFAVSYTSNVLTGDLFTGYSVVGTEILMRQFNANGSTASAELEIQSGGTRPWNYYSSIGIDDNNRPLIVWEQSAQSQEDGFANARVMAWSSSGGFGYQGGTSTLAENLGTTYTMPRVASNGNLIVTAFTGVSTSNYSYTPDGSNYVYTTYFATPSASVQNLSMVVRQSETSEYIAIAPSTITPSTQLINEDSGPLAFTLTAGNAIQISDSDADGNKLSVTVSLPANAGQLTIANPTMVINPATPGLNYLASISGTSLNLEGTVAQLNQALAQLVFTPASNFHGSTSLSISTLELYGSPSLAASGQVTIIVAPVNDAPVGVDQSKLILEDSSYTLSVSDFLFSDSADSPVNNLSAIQITVLPLSGSLTLSGTAVNVNQTVSNVDLNAGLLVFTPLAQANGVGQDSFWFKIIDDGGTAAGGQNIDPLSRSFNFNVKSVNDAPTASDQTRVMLEDSDFTFQPSDFGFADATDGGANNFAGILVSSMPSAGTLSLVGSPVGLNQLISASDIAAGKLIFRPTLNGEGNNHSNFGFRVMDTGGTNDGGSNTDPAEHAFTFNVTSVNDAPSGASQARTILEDASYTFSVTDFGFSDSKDNPANTLQGVKITTLPAVGSLTVAGTAVNLNQIVSHAQLFGGDLVFTPVGQANGTTYASLGFKVVDNGGTLNGGFNTDVVARSFMIDVLATPDTPTVLIGPLTLIEGGRSAVSAAVLSANDVDNPNPNSLVFTVNSASYGQFEWSSTPGTAIMSFTQEDINLNKVSFAHDGSELAPSYSLRLTDGVSVLTMPAPVINFSGTNDGPLINATILSITVNEDDVYVIDPVTGREILILDPDSGNGLLELTLSASNSTLTLTNLTGLNFISGANQTDSIVVRANLTDLNSALVGLTIKPDANFNGSSSLNIAVSDLGNSGSGGTKQTTLNLPISIAPVADAPTGTSLSRSLAENSTLTLNLSDFGFSDANDQPADSFTGVTITTLPSAGSLKLLGNSVTLSQVISSAQISAGSLVFQPDVNANGLNYASLGFKVMDSGAKTNGGTNLAQGTNLLSFDVTSVNNAPVIRSTNATETFDEDSSLIFSSASGNAITLSDIDAGFSIMELSLSSTDGILSLASLQGINIISGADHSNQIVLQGPQSRLNDAINGLTLTPASDFNGAIILNATLNDLGNSGAGGAKQSSIQISNIVSPFNDAPAINASTLVAGIEDSVYTFSASQKSGTLSVSDPDGNVSMQVSLSAANGLLSLSQTNGLLFTLGDGSKDTQLHFTGNVLDINAALSGLIFDPIENFFGDATLSITTSDQGGIGSGGVKTDHEVVTLRVQSVNDLPVVQAANLLSFEAGSVISVGRDKLLALDIESGAKDIVYTLMSELSDGQILLGSRALRIGDTFTQEDVNLGALRLEATQPGTQTLQLSARDKDGGLASAISISLDIKPQASFSGSSGLGSLTTSTPSITATITNISKDTSKSGSDSTAAAANALPIAPAVPTTGVESNSSQEKELARNAPNASNMVGNNVRPSNNLETSNANRIDVTRLSAESLMSHNPIAMLNIASPAPSLASPELPKPVEVSERTENHNNGISLPTSQISLDKLVTDNFFQKNLAQVREDVMQVSAIDRSVVASTIGVSASFTIGYVLWLVRGGVLISSLLASLPAWRMVDPLPILGTLANGKRGHLDDKSLEELVEHK